MDRSIWSPDKYMSYEFESFPCPKCLKGRLQTKSESLEYLSDSNRHMANKIIGNEGSHIGSLRRSDLIDAYEIIELLVESLFVKRSTIIHALAEEITNRQKPRSK